MDGPNLPEKLQLIAGHIKTCNIKRHNSSTNQACFKMCEMLILSDPIDNVHHASLNKRPMVKSDLKPRATISNYLRSIFLKVDYNLFAI